MCPLKIKEREYMRYKIQTLIIDSFGNVEIPEGWIPLNCREKVVSTLSE
jgi:hypothetical protein